MICDISNFNKVIKEYDNTYLQRTQVGIAIVFLLPKKMILNYNHLHSFDHHSAIF